MSDRERYEFPVRRPAYPHWGQADSGGSGTPFDPSLVPGTSGTPGAAEAGAGARREGAPPLKAKATAVKVPGNPINHQLEIMGLALGEVKDFIDGLREAGIESLLAQPKAQLQDVKLKRHIIGLINMITGGGEPNGLAERAGGLTDEEEALLIKAMLLLDS